MPIQLTTPLLPEQLGALRAGDTVLLSGTVYTARDAAHGRMEGCIAEGQDLPFDVQGAVIYYAGPTPTKPGGVVGSMGPTTAGRMDKYTPALLDKGLAAMIGKGARSEEVLSAMRKTGAVYFGFLGGAGALAAAHITSCQVIAWEDLGSEAVRKLTVKEFPLTVLADAHGGNLYVEGPRRYLDAQAGE